jgi:hypothetical protein
MAKIVWCRWPVNELIDGMILTRKNQRNLPQSHSVRHFITAIQNVSFPTAMLPRSVNISAMHCFVTPFMFLYEHLGYTSYIQIWQVYGGVPTHVNRHLHV